jgi:hypothetical protein
MSKQLHCNTGEGRGNNQTTLTTLATVGGEAGTGLFPLRWCIPRAKPTPFEHEECLILNVRFPALAGMAGVVRRKGGDGRGQLWHREDGDDGAPAADDAMVSDGGGELSAARPPQRRRRNPEEPPDNEAVRQLLAEATAAPHSGARVVPARVFLSSLQGGRPSGRMPVEAASAEVCLHHPITGLACHRHAACSSLAPVLSRNWLSLVSVVEMMLVPVCNYPGAERGGARCAQHECVAIFCKARSETQIRRHCGLFHQAK